MTHHIPSTPGLPPAWGPITAKMNFCEEDYHLTRFLAEPVNALSSFSYAYLALCGIYNSPASSRATFVPAYLALVLVGIGSFLCHATLLYPLQLVDDLSMLLGAAIVLHISLTSRSTPLYKLTLAVLLAIPLALIVHTHIATGDSAWHQRAFVLMIGTVAYQTMALIRASGMSAEGKSVMRRAAAWGAAAIVGGFGLWVVDIVACGQLREMRRRMGLPWAWLLELHGWWHLLTGIGVYLYIVLLESLHVATVVGDGTSVDPIWPSMLWFPHALRVRKAKET